MELKTEPVYYLDAYQTKLTATVRGLKTDEKGVWLCTDQTLFYPGGGGQLRDGGTVNELALEDMQQDNDRIWHNVPDYSGKTGDVVTLQLDWARRFYMMQQHSGQHLISHVMHTLGLKTVSVHLGEAYTLIEIDGDFPSTETLRKIELESNALIQRHLNLRIHWADRNSVAKFPLRRPAGEWQKLRIVEIEQIEFAACGGTHVINTAEIGLIKFAGIQHIRGHGRLRFYIGQAAYNYLDLLHNQAQDLKQILQAETNQLAERAASVQADLEQQTKQGEHYRRAHLNQLCQSLSMTDEPLIFRRLDEHSAEDVSFMVRTLANDFSRTAFLITGTRFYFIRPQSGYLDLRLFLKAHAQALDMRGGGPADFVQGILQLKDDKYLYKILFDFIREHSGGNL